VSLLCLGAGALVALSLPPWGVWPLAIVGVALFSWSLERDGRAGRSAGRRAALGWLFGAGWLFPGMGWMWFLTAPGYLVAGTLFASLHALAAAAVRPGRGSLLARPAAHALVEALRLVVPFGGVPLATLAIGQAGGPLLGVARIGGVVLLGWLVLQLGVALGALGRRSGRNGALAALAACAALVVVAAAAPDGRDTGRGLRIAIVQGGGEQGTRAVDTDPRVVVDRHLAATRGIRAGDVDLVVWPENVVDVARFEGSDELVAIAAEGARLGVPLAVGITEDATSAGGERRFLNAQVVVTPDGRITDRYDKVRRVPFGEYVPLRGLLEALGAPTDLVPKDAAAGTGPAALDVPLAAGDVRAGVVISWEVFFGDRARDAVRSGGEVMLNPTNGSSYTGTVLQSQQVASSRLRAVETGRWVVQAAPTGFSAFVSPGGEVLERTGVSEARVIVHDVARRTGRTWYTRTGGLPYVLLAATALVGAMWSSARAARRRVDLHEDGDGAVVDQRDRHLGAEAARGDVAAE